MVDHFQVRTIQGLLPSQFSTTLSQKNMTDRRQRLYLSWHLNTDSPFINSICDILCDLVPFVQFKKRKKHPWRSVNFSKAAGFSLQLH